MESDFVVTDGKVRFRQSFETVEDAETFSIAPAEVVDAARRLLAIDVARKLSVIIHDTIVVEIGSSRVPLFALRQVPGLARSRCCPFHSCPASFPSHLHLSSPPLRFPLLQNR